MNGPKPRRRALSAASVALLALAAASGAALPGAAASGAPGPDERRLRLYTVNQRESLDVVYRRGDALVPEAIERIEHLLRDRRNQARGPIDPRLLDLLHRLAESLGASEPFHVISAYRSPETNDARAATPGSGVARDSLHVRGQAIDVRLPGVPLERVRDAAVALKAGGVGYYPKSDFVHVDLGRVRAWTDEG